LLYVNKERLDLAHCYR